MIESEAQRFTIAAGRTIDGLAMTMSTVKTAHVEGEIIDSRGRPTGGVVLEMLATVAGTNTMSSNTVRPDSASCWRASRRATTCSAHSRRRSGTNRR